MTPSKLRKYGTARDTARTQAGYDDIVTPVRGLPLVSLGYEDERKDMHGIGCEGWSTDRLGIPTVHLDCYCGHHVEFTAASRAPKDWNAAENAAFDLLVAHAASASAAVAA